MTASPLGTRLRQRVLDRVERFDHAWSRFRDDSLVTRLAREGGAATFPKEARPLFELYGRLHDATDGAVDPLVGRDLELLGVTGVEDKLQKDVKPSLELLRNAGIKIWMLTGDKVETARCVAVSSKLVARGQYIHTIQKRTSPLPPSSHRNPH